MVREFKLREIIDKGNSFEAEIEYSDTGDRRKFGFPKNNNWEEEINGEPRFVTQIKRVLEDEVVSKEKSLKVVKEKFEGKVFNKK